MNTQLLVCIKAYNQLVKLGKYFANFNFRGSRLTAKYRENWTTLKFPILRYNKPIRSTIYNFNKIVNGIDIDSNTPDS